MKVIFVFPFEVGDDPNAIALIARQFAPVVQNMVESTGEVLVALDHVAEHVADYLREEQ